MKTDLLLIDGKNCIYRAIHAGRNDPRHDPSKRDYFVILLRFLNKYLVKFNPRSMHVFWDEKSSKLWRKKLYPDYKGNRKNDPEVEEEVNRLNSLAVDMFSNMGIYQYQKPKMEADDLIYAFSKLHKNEKTIIVSSDGDMMQIPYYFDNVSVHNPLKSNSDLEPRPEKNPAELRSLMGDKSDQIFGYDQIGPKRAAALLEDKARLNDYIEKNDIKIFARNLALIDLSLCPYTLSNIRYILKVLNKPIKYDEKELYNLAREYKVHGFMSEYKKCILSFKSLVDNC